MRPDGTSKTVSYSANPQLGFQAVPFNQLGVALPPFPQKLNTNKGQEKDEDDFVVVDRGELRECATKYRVTHHVGPNLPLT